MRQSMSVSTSFQLSCPDNKLQNEQMSPPAPQTLLLYISLAEKSEQLITTVLITGTSRGNGNGLMEAAYQPYTPAVPSSKTPAPL